MSSYTYSSLSAKPNLIRLLRLLPSADEAETIQCELFDYSLQNDRALSHPYEALSYVWGDKHPPKPIVVVGARGSKELSITPNLFNALSSLRSIGNSRTLWVDAVCINQADNAEKSSQIPLMAAIYAKASRVIVWLGGPQSGEDQALEMIRVSAEHSMNTITPRKRQDRKILITSWQAIRQLLDRPWFRRIWILQEVAAARHITIVCGQTEIDGTAFCTGLESVRTALEESLFEVESDSESWSSPDDPPAESSTDSLYESRYRTTDKWVNQIIFLIRGAVYRCRYFPEERGRFSLRICSLGELIDLYHKQEATMRHDKIFALLGMASESSEALDAAGLKPDYDMPWSNIMGNLVRFLIGNDIAASTWNDRETAVIETQCSFIGEVFMIGPELDNNRQAEISFYNKENERVSWSINSTLAVQIQEKDLICQIQGALKPSILRARKDHFQVILLALSPLEEKQKKIVPDPFSHNALIAWNWGNNVEELELPYLSNPDLTVLHPSGSTLHFPNIQASDQFKAAIRIWNFMQILRKLRKTEPSWDAAETESLETEQKMKEASARFVQAIQDGHTHSVQCQCNMIPLDWVVLNGDHVTLGLLLARGNVNLHTQDHKGSSPLAIAAMKGHTAIVKLLLETKNVDVDSKDIYNRTPLSHSVAKGHESVVKLLLATHMVNVNTKDDSDRAPLSYAAETGNLDIVNLLLETGGVDFNSKEKFFGWTPLSYAARNGHEPVVRVLLAKSDVNAEDIFGYTPLLAATEGGHEAVVKLLLNQRECDVQYLNKPNVGTVGNAAGANRESLLKLLINTDGVDIDLKDLHYGRAPLARAAMSGNCGIVRLLLETGRVRVDAKDQAKRTPLSLAAEKGHVAVVKILRNTREVDAQSKDKADRTPLSYAAECGHVSLVKLLMDIPGTDVDSLDFAHRTPLSYAAEKGHQTIIKMLMGTGKVNVDPEASLKRYTPLAFAALNGHESVVEILIGTGKVDLNVRDDLGRTPLSHAAENGHEAVVRRLINTRQVNMELKDNEGYTPLALSVMKGNKAVIKLLLMAHPTDVNVAGEHGRTLTELADLSGFESVVRILEEYSTTTE